MFGYLSKVSLSAATVATALAVGAPIALTAAPTAAVTHHECRLHGFRPYPHRHVDPGDRLIQCETPARGRGLAREARCIASAFDARGREVPGTYSTAGYPLAPNDRAIVRAEKLNAACEDALATCRSGLVRGPGRCIVIQRLFAE